MMRYGFIILAGSCIVQGLNPMDVDGDDDCLIRGGHCVNSPTRIGDVVDNIVSLSTSSARVFLIEALIEHGVHMDVDILTGTVNAKLPKGHQMRARDIAKLKSEILALAEVPGWFFEILSQPRVEAGIDSIVRDVNGRPVAGGADLKSVIEVWNKHCIQPLQMHMESLSSLENLPCLFDRHRKVYMLSAVSIRNYLADLLHRV